ncbi:MAG: type I methionyl aminopeptidase [Parcubacteria group bacterium]|nr:type I methionyl aminopeptidase [Parcubacteria group bacterium]
MVYSPQEIETLRECGARLARVLRLVSEKVAPGVSAFDLDSYAEELIREAGDEPAFKGYKPNPKGPAYPATLCVSVNEKIVHGIPWRDVIVKEGDIVSLDCGITHNGLITDSAITVPVGEVSEEAEKLMIITENALTHAIARATAGNRIGDIASVVDETVSAAGFGVIEELAGHGVGHVVHEEPVIPNVGKAGTGQVLKEGQVLAIEVMSAASTRHGTLLDDGFTFVTDDDSLSSHAEHTIVVTPHGGEILSKE